MTTSPASPSPIHVESTGTPALRWGVIGVSDIAVRKVVPAMQAGAVTPVTAIASRSFDRARDAADRLGIVHTFGTYQALLECPDVDVVYISLPNHLHMSWTLAAADAGKHILCEKPLALSSRDARTMVEHCERAGVMLMEAFMYRLHPIWSTTIDLVRQKRIGEVLAVQTVFSYFNEEPSNIRNQVDAGGGALYDVGCYAVDLARWVFDGEPQSVRGAVRHDPRFGTDVLTSALLDFGGRHATFICSTRLEPAQRVELLGTAGRIVIDIPFNISPDQPARLQVVSGGDPPTAPAVELIQIQPTDPYRVQAEAFAHAIRRGAPAPIPPHGAIRNLEVIERILSDADTRESGRAGSVSPEPVGHGS